MNSKNKSIEKIYNRARVMKRKEENSILHKRKNKQKKHPRMKLKQPKRRPIHKNYSDLKKEKRKNTKKRIKITRNRVQNPSFITSSGQEISIIKNNGEFKAQFSSTPEMAKNKRSKIKKIPNKFNRSSRIQLKISEDQTSPGFMSKRSLARKMKGRGASRKSKVSNKSKGYQLENTLSMVVKEGEKLTHKRADHDESERFSTVLKSSLSTTKMNKFKFSKNCRLKITSSNQDIKILTGEDDEGNHRVINSRTSKSPLRVKGEEEEDAFQGKGKLRNKLKFSYQGDALLKSKLKSSRLQFEPLTDRYHKDRFELRGNNRSREMLNTERFQRDRNSRIDFFGKDERKMSTKESVLTKIKDKKIKKLEKKKEYFKTPENDLRGEKISTIFEKKKKKKMMMMTNDRLNQKGIRNTNIGKSGDKVRINPIENTNLKEKVLKQILEKSKKVSLFKINSFF